MKRLNGWLVGAIVLVLGIAIGNGAQSKIDTVERWEYQTLQGNPAQLAGYNAQGNNGWELAAVACQDSLGYCTYFFKRRK